MIWPYSRWLALWGATLWFAHHGTTGEGFIFQRDFMIACLMLASSAVIIHAQESSRYDRLNQLALLAIAGVLAGYAGGIKPSILGLCAVHGLWLLVTTRGTIKDRLITASAYSAGVALIVGSFAAWIYLRGGWPYFVDIVINFIPVFRTTFLPFIAGGVLANPTSWSALFAPMAVIIWLVLVLLIFFRTHTHPRLWFAFICTLPCALHVYIQDKGWEYHYYPLYGFALVFVTLAMQLILSRLGSDSRLAATISQLGAITIMLMASWHLLSSNPRPLDISNASERRERFARELNFQLEKAAQHMPAAIREAFLAADEKPVLVMSYFCDGCNMWSSAYRLNWKSPSPYLFTQPISRRYKPYYKKPRALHPQHHRESTAHHHLFWQRRHHPRAAVGKRRTGSFHAGALQRPDQQRSLHALCAGQRPQGGTMKLYSYFRSSASYRVRIALGLKQLAYDTTPVNLQQSEQRAQDYVKLNPQGLLPTLEDSGHLLTQSLAIMEYLDEIYPNPPILPKTPAERARVRALALAIACDIAPLNNLGAMNFLKNELGQDDAARTRWYQHWIAKGFTALEAMLANNSAIGTFCHGELPTIADCCLVPQVYNARRYECDLAPYPTILRIDAACNQHPAFIAAHPSKQVDA
jgi:maleylacetoacetate isomerase